MSELRDFLTAAGVDTTEERIIQLRASLDQAGAEVSHLIDHAQKGSTTDAAVALLHSVAIKQHLEAHGPVPDGLRPVLTALIFRAAALTTHNNTLQAALAAAQEGKE